MKFAIAKRCSGMTLVETMISMGIGALLIAGVCGFVFYDSVSKAALLNYVELNQKSMQALDKMSTELREMRRMAKYSPTRIEIENADGKLVVFEWDQKERTVYRQEGGNKEIFLENCYEAEFQIFKSVPPTFGSTDFSKSKTDVPSLCKLILLRWSCERNISSTKNRNTESVQTAKIVLRN